MPNIDFYAANGDFALVLEYVFLKSGCRVFQMDSAPGEEIIEFASFGELEKRYSIGLTKGTGPSVLLQLVPPYSLELCHIRRIDFTAGVFGEHGFRYSFEGWGLIQLYLGGTGPQGLVASHSNHFTEAGARYWEHVDEGKRGLVDAWDWRKVTATSSALNRFVRKLALFKIGSRPVLPAASAAFEKGVGPVETYDIELLKKLRTQRA